MRGVGLIGCIQKGSVVGVELDRTLKAKAVLNQLLAADRGRVDAALAVRQGDDGMLYLEDTSRKRIAAANADEIGARARGAILGEGQAGIGGGQVVGTERAISCSLSAEDIVAIRTRPIGEEGPNRG